MMELGICLLNPSVLQTGTLTLYSYHSGVTVLHPLDFHHFVFWLSYSDSLYTINMSFLCLL